MSKSERTKQYIIEKTAPVFNKKGFAGTALSDMTDVTGLTKGAIYGNFENKDDVAYAAFDYNLEKIREAIRAAVAGKTPLQKLHTFTDFYRSAFKNEVLKAGCPIVNLAPEVDDTHPELNKRVKAALERWKTTIESYIYEGIKAREIKENVNAKAFATVFISLIEGSIMLSKSTRDVSYLHNSMNALDDLINIQLRK